MNTKKIGLIIPPADGKTPSECQQLYPDIQFVTVGLGIKEMSPEGFAELDDRILDCAYRLKAAGVAAISVMGTSLTFYKGGQYNEQLTRRVSSETHLPVTTMSTSVIRALKANGVSRVAIATAYTLDLNSSLSNFLNDHGIGTAGMVGLGIKSIDSVRPTSPRSVEEATEQAFKQDTSADGALISCGGLPTIQLHLPLEAKLGIPVISSLAAGLWDVVQMAGADPRVPGFGKMFAAYPARAA